MTITTKIGDRTVYLQELDNGDLIDILVRMLMNTPSGTSWTTTISNNGNDLVFRTQAYVLLDFIKVANGIKPPRKAPVRRTVTPVRPTTT